MKQGNNHKKKKVIIISIVFLTVLLIATLATYSYFAKNSKNDVIKNELFACMGNDDLNFFADHKLYTSILERLKVDNYQSNTAFTLSSTMENDMLSDLDLSKFEFNYEQIKNNQTKQNYHKLVGRYASNDLLTLDVISNEKQFALKSDEIVNRYVGTNIENGQHVIEKLFDRKIDYAILRKLKNFAIEREMINFKEIAKANGLYDYVKILEKHTKPEDVSKKENVVLTLNSEQVATTEYTISLGKNETAQVFNEISQKIKNDDKIIPELVVTNIQNFEEDSPILEYSDNDDFAQTNAEENNFESSVVIWGETNTTENTITEPQNIVENSVQNQNVTNQTENSIAQNTTNMQNTTNTVENTTIPPSTTIEIEEEPQTEQNQQPQPEAEVPEQPQVNNQQSRQPVVENENLRPQGFIQVNEGDETQTSDFLIGKNWEETFDNLVKMAEKIDWKTYLLTGARANFSQDELVAQIQKVITDRMNEDSGLVVKAYVSENQLVKLNFQMVESQKSFDIEILSKSENEKYLNVSVLEGETSEANGYTVNLYKNDRDTSVKNSVNVNKVSKGKITQKMILDLETKGKMNAKKYTTEIDFHYLDSKGEFELKANHTLNFEAEAQIEELNDENCLFLDQVSEEELLLIKEEIKQKTLEVLSDKNRSLNIVDMGSSGLVVQQTQPQEQPEEMENDRLAARDAFVQTVADKMRDYLNEGRELQLQDLEGLEVPGYEVEISISSNLAIVTVGGYRFTLDADFNLSDS